MGAKIYVHKVKKLIFSGTETLFKAGVFAEKLTKNKITLTIPDKMMKTSFSVAMILALATGTHINSSVSLDHELDIDNYVFSQIMANSTNKIKYNPGDKVFVPGDELA